MSFGQVEYDITQAPTPITLSTNAPVRLPPAGNEFATNLAGFSTDFDDAGGKTATIRYTGAAPALVQLSATMSFERLPGSSSQHVFIGWAVGAPPLTVASVSPNTRQETDLAFDAQDTILHVDGAFVMQPGDEAQVWVRQVPFSAGEDMLFLVNGFMLTASVVATVQPPAQGSHCNLVYASPGPSAVFQLPNAGAVKLPPAAEFATLLRNSADFADNGPGSVRYTGAAPKTFKVSGTVTLQRVQGLDSELTLYLNAGSPPTDGSKDSPSAQSLRVDSSNESAELHAQGLLTLAPNDGAELWLSRTPGGQPYSVRVVRYSLTLTQA